MIRMRPPSKGASISIARTAPDAEGCVMVNESDVTIAQSHGWKVDYDSDYDDEQEVSKEKTEESSHARSRLFNQ